MEDDSKKNILKTGALFAVGMVILLSILHFVGFGKIISALGQLYLPYYIVVIIIIVGNVFLWSYRWRLFIGINYPEVSAWETMKTTAVGLAINNLTPMVKMGGEAARVYLLKVRHGIRGREGLATVTSDLTMEFIVDFMVVVISVIFFMVFLSPPVWLYGIMFAFVIMSSLIIFSILGLYTGQKIISKIIKWFCKKIERFDAEATLAKYETFRETFRKTLKNRRKFLGAISLTVLRKIFTILKYYILLAALGHTISPASIVIAIGVGYMLMTVPLTPGSLGVFEGGMISMFVILGVPAGVAAAAVFLDRLIWFWGTTGVGSLLGTYYGLNLMGSKVIESYKNADTKAGKGI